MLVLDAVVTATIFLVVMFALLGLFAWIVKGGDRPPSSILPMNIEAYTGILWLEDTRSFDAAYGTLFYSTFLDAQLTRLQRRETLSIALLHTMDRCCLPVPSRQ